MKITNQDIKTLNKISKICDNTECKDCLFDTGRECILHNQPNWWNLKGVKIDEGGIYEQSREKKTS